MRWILLLLLAPCVAFGQNLVPNPSFEEKDTCPDDLSQLDTALFWYNPTISSPDYYSCALVPLTVIGYQNARTDSSYAGFFTYYKSQLFREYLEVQLTTSLLPNVTYYASMYVSLADSMNYATDDIGMHLSQNNLTSGTWDNFPVIPQISNTEGSFITDKVGWTLISGSFTATGGESYLLIGNFKDDLNTDSLSVPGGGTLIWPDSDGAYYYVDDVCVSSDTSECDYVLSTIPNSQNNTLSVHPNPTSGVTTITNGKQGIFNIKVLDIFGRPVPFTAHGQTIDISHLPKGVYIVRVGEAVRKVVLQ